MGVSRYLSTRQSMKVQTAMTASATVEPAGDAPGDVEQPLAPAEERSLERPIRGIVCVMFSFDAS